MVLAARHRRATVVQHENGHVAVVVDGVQERGQPSVSECGVADDRDHGLLPLHRLGDAVRLADPGSHRQARVHPTQRRQGRQRVAADIAGHEDLVPRQRREDVPVRAARAQHRRAGRKAPHRLSHAPVPSFAHLDPHRCQPRGQPRRGQLADPEFGGQAFDGEARRQHPLQQEGLQLLDDDDPVEPSRELPYPLCRERVGHA